MSLKLICLDTETTGFSTQYDRIIEIGCVDITNGWNNKRTFQKYINPNRSVPAPATAVHGLTEDFLQKFEPFPNHIDEFLEFIKDATLIIHNANFDMRFLNAELERYNRPKLENSVIDTLEMARKMFPGKKAGLSALQNQFNIQIAREKHGALLDSEILAQVYLAMQMEQTSLNVENKMEEKQENFAIKKILVQVSECEMENHKKIMNELKK